MDSGLLAFCYADRMRKTAVLIIALSVLVPWAAARAHGAASTPAPSAAPAHGLEGSWEGAQKGSAGTYTLTITGRSLRYQGPSAKEWYEDAERRTIPAAAPRHDHAESARG
jgi:hypothetical protein